MEGPAAPAGADFEDVVGGLEAEVATEGVVFLALGGFESEAGLRPLRGGIHHRRVEEEREEIVGEIVVFADVALRGSAGIGAQEMAEAVERPQGIEREGFGLGGAGEGGRGIGIEDEERDDGGEIGRLPVAVDVGFGKADVAGEGALVEKFFAADADDGGGRETERETTGERVGVGADIMHGAVGELEAEVAAGHFAEGAEHGRAEEGRFDAGGNGRGRGGDGVFVHAASEGTDSLAVDATPWAEWAMEAWGR